MAGKTSVGGEAFFAGQYVSRLVADDHRAGFGFEDRQQADLSALASGRVPGEPDAIGVADSRFAVMSGKLLRRIDVFPLGLPCAFRFDRVVESIDDELPGYGDRFVVLVVKVNAAAEAAGGRFAG